MTTEDPNQRPSDEEQDDQLPTLGDEDVVESNPLAARTVSHDAPARMVMKPPAGAPAPVAAPMPGSDRRIAPLEPGASRGPRPGAGGLRLATRGSRFVASLFDGLVAIGIAICVGMAFGVGIVASGAEVQDAAVVALVGILTAVIYFGANAYLIFKDGQTIGKRMVGIRVVRTNGEQVDGWRYLLVRLGPWWLLSWIGEFIPVLGSMFSILWIVNVLLIFRREHNCLHDDMADTRVVVSRSPRGGRR